MRNGSIFVLLCFSSLHVHPTLFFPVELFSHWVFDYQVFNEVAANSLFMVAFYLLI